MLPRDLSGGPSDRLVTMMTEIINMRNRSSLLLLGTVACSGELALSNIGVKLKQPNFIEKIYQPYKTYVHVLSFLHRRIATD